MPVSYCANHVVERVLAGNSVVMADTLTRSIPVGTGPSTRFANADGSRLYVANILDASITVINTNTDPVIVTVPLNVCRAPSAPLIWRSRQTAHCSMPWTKISIHPGL